MIIKNGYVYTEKGCFEQMDIGIKDKVFDMAASDGEVFDATDHYVIPGLIDIHFHGCAGYDFCDGTVEAIEKIASYEASCGITTIVPATMTFPDEILTKIFAAVVSYNNEEHIYCADFAGINMEGPYIAEAKKGAQNKKYIRTPDYEHFKKLNEYSGNMIKLVCVAPEVEGAMEFIHVAKEDVKISVAHTVADFGIANQAFLAGATQVTHLYNAMNGFHHRDPGVIGAAFENETIMVELISDGVHIHPTVIRATFRLFGSDRVILISDSMMATGLVDGIYSLGGQEVTVRGNLATLADGTVAASVTNLYDCMKTAVGFGIPLEDAIKCVTQNPAKAVGIYNKYGSISEGKCANLVILDKYLNITAVILRGIILPL